MTIKVSLIFLIYTISFLCIFLQLSDNIPILLISGIGFILSLIIVVICEFWNWKVIPGKWSE